MTNGLNIIWVDGFTAGYSVATVIAIGLVLIVWGLQKR